MVNWNKKGGFPVGYVDSVRTPIEDGDVNGDVNGDGEAEVTLPPLPNAYEVYQNNIGLLTPFIADGIDNWLKMYPAEWIPAAIEEAAKNSGRNFKYCDAILKRWAVDGFKSQKKKSDKPANNSGLLADLHRLEQEAACGN
jgi:DnaD/phage-associated family protein